MGSIQSLPISQVPLGPVRATLDRYRDLFEAHPNVWLKGGAARGPFLCWAKKKELGIHCLPPPPRDVDLVYIGPPSEGWVEPPGVDMDYERSLQSYFGSRDVGVNEVLLRPERLLYTLKALRDVRREHIHPSTFELGGEEGLSPRVGLRTILFALEERLTPAPTALRAARESDGFDILVHLYKAYEKGIEDEFLSVLRQMHHPEVQGYTSADELLLDLLEGYQTFVPKGKQVTILREVLRRVRESLAERYTVSRHPNRKQAAGWPTNRRCPVCDETHSYFPCGYPGCRPSYCDECDGGGRLCHA